MTVVRGAGKSIIVGGGGGRYSYIHVRHHLFPLKAIVFTVCEHEYMNIYPHPTPPIIDFPAPLTVVIVWPPLAMILWRIVHKNAKVLPEKSF
jgi:hypothetical protein